MNQVEVESFLKKEILKILEEKFSKLDYDSLIFKSESRLREDLQLKSIELALLTVVIEDKFDVDVFENDFPKTFGDIVNSILVKGEK